MFLADCSGVSGSPGVYSIQVDPQNSAQAACLEGGWTVIQSRQGRTKCRIYIYIYIEKGKQINQKYTSNICKYISTFVLVNTDQTLN